MKKIEPQTILIVDDEIEIQKLLSFGLEEHGFKTITASSGEEALRITSIQIPACILLDVGLSKMNGIETLQELRLFTNTPIIMLTVEKEDELKIRALDLGADDFVTKPFSLPVLRARIQAVLRRRDPNLLNEPSEVFSINSLKVDFLSHKVWVKEKEVHLTATEFDLLELFIEKRGRVLTHKVILSKIWGNQAGDQMHYLRVYINNLRRKIEINPSIPKLIVTEPGVGYRFET